MRIAYLINQYPKVSHSFIRREIRALERRGFDIVRIAMRGWDEQVTDEQDEEERKATRYVLQGGAYQLMLSVMRIALKRPVRIIGVLKLAWRMSRQSERSLLTHLIYVAEACQILAWFDEAQVEHLHAHFGTNPAEVAMMVHALGGPPWSFTVHGPEEFDKAGAIHLAEKIEDCAFVVAISSFGRSQLFRLVRHHIWPKIHIVHCGLDSSFLTVPETPPSATARLVCVGRLSEQKGHLVLLEAARRLAQDGWMFELILAGDGELRPDVEAFILLHGLSNCIKLTGWINESQVRSELLASRALVLASFAEGLPVVIMEAMALRRPVISTYVAGIPELVQSGEQGWLVPAGDVDQLVNAVQSCLAATPETRVKMGRAAHKRVAEFHDVDEEAAKLALLFKPSTEEKVAGRRIQASSG